jgi:tetratricopeptide (TPR) repeat protein
VRIWIPCLFVVAIACAAAAPDVRADDTPQRLQTLERSVSADAENLTLAADYRHLIVETKQFDRSIDFFEHVAKKSGGPNAELNLALAYVDKVPAAGDIRRLYLGRDAMNAITKSIARRPCVLAYYLRGVINLYYNRFIFNRTDKGVADLAQALAMTNDETPPLLVARVYTSLGDGYFKLGQAPKAREVWSTGAAKFPQDAALQSRLEHEGQQLEWIVGAALAAERRVDTSLAGLLPIR